ncbi:hypothetical protein RCL1_002481 [Eukaryota sp. TZLM3-RCL]
MSFNPGGNQAFQQGMAQASQFGQQGLQTAQNLGANAGQMAGQAYQGMQNLGANAGQVAGQAYQGMQNLGANAGQVAGQAYQGMQNLGANAGQVAGQAYQGMQNLGSNVGQVAGQVANSQAFQTAQNVAQTVGANAGRVAGQAYQGMQNVGSNVGQVAGQVANSQAFQTAQNVAQTVGANAGRVAGQAYQGMQNVGSNVGQVAGQVANSQAFQAAQNVAQNVGSNIGQVAGQVANSQAFQTAQNVAQQVGQKGMAAAQSGIAAVKDLDMSKATDAMNKATDAMKKATEVAQNTAPKFVGAASYVVREGGQFTSKVATATKDLWNSDIIKKMPKPNFSAVSSVYAMSRDQLLKTIAVLTGAARFLFDFVKFDIFRDFGQIISLFFVTFRLPEAVAAVFRFFEWLSNVIALNVQVFLDNMTPLIWFYFFSVLSVIMLIIMLVRIKNDPDEIRDGHELISWQERAKVTRIMAQILLTGLTSLYLVVSRNSVAVMLCAEEFKPTEETVDYLYYYECYVDSHWVHIVWAAISFLSITVYVPILCARLVKKNKPKPRLFDAEGKPKEYTIKDYHEDLLKDKSPYLFLYEGYEMQYSQYKVFIMIMKFMLVLPIISFSMMMDDPESDNIVRELIVFIILLVFCVVSFVTAPFIRDVDDKIDASARLTTVITCLVSIAVIHFGQRLSGGVVGGFLTFLHSLNALFMVGCTLAGLRCVKLKWQAWTGTIYFTDNKEYDLFRERKFRVGHPFWESLFLNDENLKPCFSRLMEIKDVVAEVGFDKYREALLPIPQSLAMERHFIESALEGIDVYWYTENVADGKLDSKTCFGKLWIKPFPFRCVFVYDDSDDYVFIPDHEVVQLAQVNRTQEIIRRRSVRQQLRCLHGQTVYFFYQCWKSKTVDDGTDSQGRRKTRTIRVFFTFTHGVLKVDRNKASQWSAGFRVRLELFDGYGEAEGRVFDNERETLGHSQLGIDYEFNASQPLVNLLLHPENAPIIAAAYPRLIQHHQEYRNNLMHERRQKELTLSWGFWYHVYNNSNMFRQELEYYLVQFEHNPHLKNLPVVHRQGLDYLYARLHHYNSHPAIAYWFVFWSDLWDSNNMVKPIKANANILCTNSANAIAYTPMPREQLTKLLNETGLMRKLGPHLDDLYFAMDSLAANPFPL